MGPIGHTDTFWVMTRKRLESGPGIQRAYGVLDKFKVSRFFFTKTEQASCETLPEQEEAIDPTPSPLSTYGPPVAQAGGAEEGLDAVLLDGAATANSTDAEKIGNDLEQEGLIEVVGEPEVLIETNENYVPIHNSIGYQGKDVAGEELGNKGVEQPQESSVKANPKPIVEMLKEAAEA